MKKIVILCGGIGGAKLVKGFYNNSDFDLTVIVNTGDDAFIHGVHLSPDLDSVMYALAGVEGKFGWGRKNDSFEANKIYSELMKGFEFQLGDMDLGVNLYRTQTKMVEFDLIVSVEEKTVITGVATLMSPRRPC